MNVPNIRATTTVAYLPSFRYLLDMIFAHVRSLKVQGTPGIEHLSIPNADPTLGQNFSGDYLLFRDEAGNVRGIFQRYARDISPFIKTREFCVVVHPQYRRRGIATSLLLAATQRWKLDFCAQTYTRPGASLVRAYHATAGEARPPKASATTQAS